MSVLLDAVLKTATVADVLRLARVEPPQNERRAIRCPLPGHDERTPSFLVQRSGRGFRCHGCSAHGGTLDLAVALGLARSRSAAVELLGSHYHIPSSAARREMQQPAIAPAFVRTTNVDAKATAADREKLRASLRRCVPLDGTLGVDYLATRGLCSNAATSNDVRFHPSWLAGGPAVVFAVRDRAGRVVAAQGRYLDVAVAPKAKTKGPLSLGVYATAAALKAEAVAICEAPIDALSLAACELPAIALCGATNGPAWLREALAFRSVVLATDNDAAGNAAADRLRTWLNLGTRCSRLVLPMGCKDTNELLRRDPAALLDLARSARRIA